MVPLSLTDMELCAEEAHTEKNKRMGAWEYMMMKKIRMPQKDNEPGFGSFYTWHHFPSNFKVELFSIAFRIRFIGYILRILGRIIQLIG
jgi:hypothetical protein